MHYRRMTRCRFVPAVLLLGGCFSETEPLEMPGAGTGHDATSDGPAASDGLATDDETGAWSGTGVVTDGGDDSPSGSDAGASTDSDDGHDDQSDTAATDDGGVAICGDGIVEGDEACDEPPQPTVDGCTPQCAAVPTRRVELSASFTGDLGEDPVAFADEACPDGYKAMFAFGDSRRATTQPWGAQGSVDWVLAPYTAYTRADGTLLWVTDDVPLLGVRNHSSQPLLAPLVATLGLGFMTGMRDDWRTLEGGDCAGWSTGAATEIKHAGVSGQVESFGFLDNGGEGPCTNFDAFYCVEQ